MTPPTNRRVQLILGIACMLCGLVFVNSAAAQFHLPGMPGSKKKEPPQQQQPPDSSQMPQMPQMPPQAQQRQQQSNQPQVKPPGIPIPDDSPVFNSFRELEKQPAYRMTMAMESNDPRMAQAAAQGLAISPADVVVKNGVKQVVMHMKMPAMDQPGTIDDWEIRAVAQNGRVGHIISSSAAARLQKANDRMLQMELQMLEQQAKSAALQAAMAGPFAPIQAAVAAGGVAASIAGVKILQEEQKKMFSWQCQDSGSVTENEKSAQMTDLRVLDDQTLGGVQAATYEFYVRSGDQFNGPLHLLVAKQTNIPLRIEMSDPRMNGSMHIDYSFDNIPEIQMPPCMGGGK